MSAWLSLVFSHPSLTGALAIAAKTACVYVFLVVGLRIAGQRQLGQMNVYDLVLIIVLANAVQNAMVGEDTTLGGGIVSATTLLLLNWLVNEAMERSPEIERRLIGEPVVLVDQGKILRDRMKKMGVTNQELASAVRERGIESPEDTLLCVLEPDGEISVIANDGSGGQHRHHYRGLRTN